MKFLMLLTSFVFANFSYAEECTPEATRNLASLMVKVTDASKTVNAYNQKHKVDSTQKSDLIMFCLDHTSHKEFQTLFKEAAPAVNNLEEFGNGQTGPCRESALKASKDLEDNVRKIMAKFQKCKQNQ